MHIIGLCLLYDEITLCELSLILSRSIKNTLDNMNEILLIFKYIIKDNKYNYENKLILYNEILDKLLN